MTQLMKLDDLRYLTRGFLEKRAEFGKKETSLLNREAGVGGFELLLDTTGSRKCDDDAAFLPKAKHGHTGEHDQEKNVHQDF